MNRRPELLLPAGNMRTLKTALRFGADAVYCGLKQYGLRAQAGNLTQEELAEAARLCHAQGAKIYITLNIFAREGDRDGLIAMAREARDLGADAAIVSDLGMIDRLGREVPDLHVHVSTQANCTNSDTVLVYRALGARRVVLARETRLQEIEEMASHLPKDMELEAFVHGAECMAYSGRCMLSSYLNGRSANRGACTQPCRWTWLTEVGKSQPELLAEEEAGGTAIFSAYDLCMVDHLPQLMPYVSSLKVEGRMKNELYVATVGRVYREAIDFQGTVSEAQRAIWHEELEKVTHRPYDTGFYFGHPEKAGEAKTLQNAEYCGFVLSRENDRVLVEMKNRFFVGDTLEAVTPQGIVSFPVSDIEREADGTHPDSVRIPLDRVYVPCEDRVQAGDLIRGPVRNRKNT